MLDKMIIQDYPGIQVGRDWEWIKNNVPIRILRKFIVSAKETFTPVDFKNINFINASYSGRRGFETWRFAVDYRYWDGHQMTDDRVEFFVTNDESQVAP
jgi:hypothetical protein